MAQIGFASRAQAAQLWFWSRNGFPASVVFTGRERDDVTARGVPSRGARAAFVGLIACVLLSLPGCANSYAGIPSAPNAADPEIQSLARRAQAGDKQAQLDLGIRFEEGRGVPRDITRARRLYLGAARTSPLSSTVYVPGSGGRGGSTTTLYSGASNSGIPAAVIRYCAIAPAPDPAGLECPPGGELAASMTLLSYDLNWRGCADDLGISVWDSSRFREMRGCLVDRTARIRCENKMPEALAKAKALSVRESRLASLAPAIATVGKGCGFRRIAQRRPGRVPPASRSLTPLDTAIERSSGIFRQSHEHYSAEAFMTLMCRLGPRDRGIELLPVEQSICDIVIRRGV